VDPDEQAEVDAILAIIAADKDAPPHEPESPLGLLPYQASNDNSERSWLGWLWLMLSSALRGKLR
jgi:hypothetical protein